MKVWFRFFILFNWVIFMFPAVNLPGCILVHFLFFVSNPQVFVVQTFAGLHRARMVDENLRLQHTDVLGERNQDFPTTGTVDGSEILLITS